MRLKPENKEKIRLKIIGSAAETFRKRGINAVTLDDLMQGADLTRGAFYAHFKSKSDLVADVLRHDHPLLRMLVARTGETPTDLWQQMRDIFDGYLNPAHLDEVYEGCTLAALTDVPARSEVYHREAYEAALRDIALEMQRGLGNADQMLAAVVTASGAVSTARACANDDMRKDVLTGARQQVFAILDAARPGGT